jgi:WhiB family transcriptional regulator, redox-sensing transcriptional regulator
MSALADELEAEWEGQDWRHRAACRDVSPALFHPGAPGEQPDPPAAGSDDPDPYAAAKRICRARGGCPVLAECLAWALGDEQDGPREMWGVWGGLDPLERQELQQRRHRRPGAAGRATDEPVLAAVGAEQASGGT